MQVRKTFLRVLLIAGCLFCFFPDLRGQLTDSKTPQVILLDQAVELALRDNRNLKNASLDVSKVEEQLAAMRTRRLPSFHLDVSAAQQLMPIEFIFDPGVFGNFPLIGPVPAKQTDITTPLKMTAIFNGRVVQPLSQLYRINLRLAQLRLTGELAREQLREKQHEIVQSVKQAYFAILQTQSGLQSASENVKLYHELDRITSEYVSQNVALKADSLDVKVRSAKSEYDVFVLGDQLAILKQQLNRLLGRDPLTEFSVSLIPEGTGYEVDLAASRSRALEQRPELRQARLKIQQAEEDRRAKKAEFIPDASLSFQYFSLRNFRDFLPKNIASAGVTLNWEVFDWGRKKHELNEKNLIIEQTNNELRETETSVLIEIDDKFRKLQQSRQLLRIAELSQQAATENVRVMKNRYLQQASLIKDVLQAQTVLEQANYQYQQASSSFWIAKAEFEKAIGEDK